MKTAILKLTNWVKKHDNLFVILLFFLSIYGIVFWIPITDTDEIWNLANLYKLYNGFEIYKEVNIIVTPLFFWIGLILFKILGANIFVFRIYHIIIMLALYLISYKLLKELKINKKIAIFIVLFLIVYEGYYFLTGQANYNTMALLFCLIGVYLSLKEYKYNSLIQGMILFLVFATKQNIGVLYAVGLLASTILEKNNLKEKIKKYVVQSAVAIFLILLMLFYFYQKNLLYSFFDLTVLGIQEFAEKNIYIEIKNLIIMLFLIIMNLILAIVFIKNQKVNIRQKKNIIILESFSIPLSLIVVPILNKMHFLLASWLLIITFSYLISILLKELKINIKEKILEIILILFAIFTISYSTCYFIGWIQAIKKNPNIEPEFQPFSKAVIPEEIKTRLKNVLHYMQNNENNVIVLSTEAEFYAILRNQNNGILDLPLRGNLGKEGEKGLLEKIKNLHNTEILIEKQEENMLWQESIMVRRYIQENMEKIGEIEEFEVYRKK